MDFLKNFNLKNKDFKLQKFKKLIDGMSIAVYRHPSRKMGKQYYDTRSRKDSAVVMTSPDGKAWQAVKNKRGYQKFIADLVKQLPDTDVILIDYAGPEGPWPISTAMQDRAAQALKWIIERYTRIAVTGTSKGGWMAWKMGLKFDIPAVVCCPVGQCGADLGREHAPAHWTDAVFEQKGGKFFSAIMPITADPKILYLHGSRDKTFPWLSEPRPTVLRGYIETNKVSLSIIEGGTHNLYDSGVARTESIVFIKKYLSM